jgi:hypothetical protein
MAGQYLSGDKSVMQNLGRGAQGAENIVKLRAEITRQAKEAGLKPDQIATKMADFAGRTAAMRALGTRGVNVEYAANTANKAIDLAEEAVRQAAAHAVRAVQPARQLVDEQNILARTGGGLRGDQHAGQRICPRRLWRVQSGHRRNAPPRPRNAEHGAWARRLQCGARHDAA